jgi:sugar lactone lactonase YvrE
VSSAEQLTGPIADFGEAPVWIPAAGGLLWVDQAAGDVLRLGEDGVPERWHVGDAVAVVRRRVTGGLVLALGRAFALTEGWGRSVRQLDEVWPDADLRFNDGACDPEGRFWCGSTPLDYAGARAGLHRLDPDGTVVQALDGIGISNGLAWTPDATGAYYVDTLTGRIDRFDYSRERGLYARRIFVRIEDDAGYPDGLCVDADGRVWVALWNGAAVRCYSTEGKLEDVVVLPVRQVTACTFGGAALDELYVTTKRQGFAPGEETTAGALFRVAPGVTGLPAAPFGG